MPCHVGEFVAQVKCRSGSGEGDDDLFAEGECKKAQKHSPNLLKEGASGSECSMVDFQSGFAGGVISVRGHAVQRVKQCQEEEERKLSNTVFSR